MDIRQFYPPEQYRQTVNLDGAERFVFAAAALDHGHIYGMCAGLKQAGGYLKYIYDRDREKAQAFAKSNPGVTIADSEDQILGDPEVLLVASAAIPSERCALGMRVMDAGKDYFTYKAPFTSLAQLEEARKKVAETGKKYAVYYAERLQSEAGVYAGFLIDDGAIGKVVNVLGLGPHRLNASTRPSWFFQKKKYGGILCDIGSHQVEQYLYYAKATDAVITSSKTANIAHPDYPELEDFGEVTMTGSNGTTNYFRVDWFTPDGLSSWGDGRTIILGTEGYIELRKYVNVATTTGGNHVFLVNGRGEFHIQLHGELGTPFFSSLIYDCLYRTETAMTQAHVFKAAQLCLEAQSMAQNA